MAETFKLPGASFEEVKNIIKGYAQLDKPATIREISNATKLSDGTISRNSRFLMAIGVITPGAKKAPTEIGKRLGRALMYDKEDETKWALGKIVMETEFLNNIVGAVRIRNGMDENSLKSHIAYSAGAKKSPATTSGAGAIVDMLKFSGHLEDEDGKIAVGAFSSTNDPTPSATAEDNGSKTQTPNALTLTPSGGVQLSPSLPMSQLQVSINIDVKCSADDLDALGERLRKVMYDIEEKANAGNAETEGSKE